MWIKSQASFHMDELAILEIQTSFRLIAHYTFLKGLLKNLSFIRSFPQHAYGFHLNKDQFLFDAHSTNLL